MQDSTPILELLEERHPEPGIHPEDPALRFLANLLEEYADEWVNKLMFHYRWGYPADQKHRSRTLAEGSLGGLTAPWFGKLMKPLMAPLLVRRMVPRMAFAGATENNRTILISSFARLVELLELHLQERPYVFGGRPAMADFGLWGQLHQAFTDPSCHKILEDEGPAVVAWIKRMESPEPLGDFDTLDNLIPTLSPIFSDEVGPRFLAWAAANARAWERGEKQTGLTMAGQRYYQKTFKYPAQGFARLRSQFAVVSDNAALKEFLDDTGCLKFLAPGP
jgi:glutathione S-transferase